MSYIEFLKIIPKYLWDIGTNRSYWDLRVIFTRIALVFLFPWGIIIHSLRFFKYKEEYIRFFKNKEGLTMLEYTINRKKIKFFFESYGRLIKSKKRKGVYKLEIELHVDCDDLSDYEREILSRITVIKEAIISEGIKWVNHTNN